MPSTTRGRESVMANLNQPFDARLQARHLLTRAEATAPFAPLFVLPFLPGGADDRLTVLLFPLTKGRSRAEHVLLVLAAGSFAVLARDIDTVHQQPRPEGGPRCAHDSSQRQRHRLT